MKKSISILAIAMLASSMSLTAQNRAMGAPVGAGEKLGKPGWGLMKELNLTDDQQAKLKVLRQEFAVKDSVTKEQFQKQRESLRAEHQKALAKILTPEQLVQLDKLQVERAQKGQKAGRGQFGPGMGFRGQAGMNAGQGRMMGQAQGMNGRPFGNRAQMLKNRGRMMQMRGHMMQNRGRMMQMRDDRPGFSKKDAKAFAKQAKRMNRAPMVNPEVRIKNQVDRMTTLLDLTPEQAAKIQAIQEKHFKKDIAKYKRFEKKRDAQFKKRHGNMDEIKAVLSPDQLKKFEALKEKAPLMNGQGFQGGRQQAPNGAGMGQMHGPMNGFVE